MAKLCSEKLTHEKTLKVETLESKSTFQLYSSVTHEMKLFMVAQKVTPVTHADMNTLRDGNILAKTGESSNSG